MVDNVSGLPRQKLLLDTDIGYGTDADDALALAYLLLQPDCDLVGVTTVGLRADWRAELVDVICQQMGRPEVPIAAGADAPFYENFYWPINPVRQWPETRLPQPRRKARANEAVAFMRRVIRESPGAITLVTIGQFTNLALLLLEDPEAVAMLKGVISMGGVLGYAPGRPEAECNVMLDPVAAGIVLQRLPGLILLPGETVHGKDLDQPLLKRLLANDRLNAVHECCLAWMAFKGRTSITLADPVTVALAFKPELAHYEPARIGVHLHDFEVPAGNPFVNDAVTGVTHIRPDCNGPEHRLVTRVDKDQVFRHLLEVFSPA